MHLAWWLVSMDIAMVPRMLVSKHGPCDGAEPLQSWSCDNAVHAREHGPALGPGMIVSMGSAMRPGELMSMALAMMPSKPVSMVPAMVPSMLVSMVPATMPSMRVGTALAGVPSMLVSWPPRWRRVCS